MCASKVTERPIDLMSDGDAAVFRNDTRWQTLEKLAVGDASGNKLFDLITTALTTAFIYRAITVVIEAITEHIK